MTVRCGEARFPWTKYKTSQYCIAYLDILGGADKICNDDNNDFLNHLNMFMDDALQEAKRSSSKNYGEIFTKIFSDNILFAIETEENDPHKKRKIENIFNLVFNLYNEVFSYGHLMRGAIVLGNFFHNENIVYGEGLVKAVKIEEKEAIYPRIIVQNEIVELLPHYCMQDSSDNNFILNTFLSFECLYPNCFKRELLDMLKENEQNNCINEDKKIKIRKKIMWFINYFNSWFINSELYRLERIEITDKEIQEAMQL